MQVLIVLFISLSVTAWIMGLVYSIIWITVFFDGDEMPCTPKGFYKNTKMNRLGCMCVSLVLWIYCPLIAIFKFFYWIFHVGRRDK